MYDTLENGRDLPLRASGEFLSYKWEFRGDVVSDSARQWVSLISPDGYRESGSVGPLPFADLGWKTLGHIGSYGWSSNGWSKKGFRRVYQPSFVSGIIAQNVAKILVFFKSGISEEGLIIKAGRPDLHFFFLPYPPREQWTETMALDIQENELDRVMPF